MDLQQHFYTLVHEPLEQAMLVALVRLYLCARSLRRAVRARAYFRRSDLIRGTMARMGGHDFLHWI